MSFSNISKNKKIAIALMGIFVFSIIAVPLAMGANPDLTALLKDIEAKLWSNSNSVKSDTSAINAKIDAIDAKLTEVNSTVSHIYISGWHKATLFGIADLDIGHPAKVTVTFYWTDDTTPGAVIEVYPIGFLSGNYTLTGNGNEGKYATIIYVLPAPFDTLRIGPIYGGYLWEYWWSAEY